MTAELSCGWVGECVGAWVHGDDTFLLVVVLQLAISLASMTGEAPALPNGWRPRRSPTDTQYLSTQVPKYPSTQVLTDAVITHPTTIILPRAA